MLKNLVAFCVLMQNGDGILDKSPDYILEKAQRYLNGLGKDTDDWCFGLDTQNEQILDTWIKKWLEK